MFVTSNAFDATNLNEISAWVRKGADSFSENPEGNEDLIFEYSNNGTTWIEIDTFEASGAGSLANGEIVTPTYTAPADFVTSSTFQLRIRLRQASGAAFDFWHVDDVCFAGGQALPTVLKTVVVESDPQSGTTNPKAIPGATMLYSIHVSNSGDGSVDDGTVLVSDTLDASLSLFVDDLAGDGSPFIFTDGSGANISGLVYEFISLGSTVDSPTFLNSASAPITPTSIGGYDPTVRGFQISLPGQLFPANTGTPEFTITYRVRLD